MTRNYYLATGGIYYEKQTTASDDEVYRSQIDRWQLTAPN